MTDDQVRQILDRVLSWPRARQEDAAQMLLALEEGQGKLYHPEDDEWRAIEEGRAQAERGESVPDDEIAALLKPRGPRDYGIRRALAKICGKLLLTSKNPIRHRLIVFATPRLL